MTAVNALLAVDRDNAKAMFAAREPDALRLFLKEYQYSPEQRLDVADCWQEVNEFLQKIGQENEGLAVPLAMVFNGGRPLLNEPPEQIFLVRPDVVGYLGNILGEFNLEEFECSDNILSELARLRDFYAQAAKTMQCVIFTKGILCDN